MTELCLYNDKSTAHNTTPTHSICMHMHVLTVKRESGFSSRGHRIQNIARRLEAGRDAIAALAGIRTQVKIISSVVALYFK